MLFPFHRPASLRGFIDWHSHLLPGVDDGVQTTADALKILEEYEKTGVREVWFTPHIMEDMPNTPDDLRRRFQRFQEVYTGPVTLHLAAEHMLDPLFEQRLATNDVLPIGPEGNLLLVETSYFNPPIDLYGLLHRIRSQGYFPLLAHPERYVYMDEHDYRKLQALEVRFQLNLPSLVGAYGKEAKQKARWLLKQGMYYCAGTDIHRKEMLAYSLAAAKQGQAFCGLRS